MSRKYVPDGVWLTCSCGTCFSQLKVFFHARTQIYSTPYATEGDRWPFLNIRPMGLCSMKAGPAPLCVPSPVIWQQVKEGVYLGPFRALLEDSKAKCLLGGTISIHFSKAAAMASAPFGTFKKPSEYISDFFTWSIDGANGGLASTKSWLAEKGAPQWMLASVDGLNWYVDFELGLAEGAINAVVGLVEVIYDITQDPVGAGSAIVEGVCSGAKSAWDWSSKGDNWQKAADDTWNFISDPGEWQKAAASAVEWLQNNPRKLGNVAGEVAETALEVAFTAGSATAAKAGGKVTKEVMEEVVEKGAKEATEKATKELGEKAAKEKVEDAAEKGGKRKIAKVVTGRIKPKPPFKRSAKHNTDALKREFERQLRDQEDAINNMTVKDWLKNREEFNTNRSSIEKRAQRERTKYRKQEFDKRVKEYRKANPKATEAEAKKYAKDSMEGQAALHNPDGIAGGKPGDITGMGDSSVNSSIGSQWKGGRAASIEEQVKQQYGIPPNKIGDISDDAMMDVDLMLN